MAKPEDQYAELKRDLSKDAKLGAAVEVLKKNPAWLRVRGSLMEQAATFKETAVQAAYERKGADAQKAAASAFAIDILLGSLDLLLASGEAAKEQLAELEEKG